MGPFTTDYNHSDEAEPHIQRCREMIKKYPQIKDLMGRNINTIFYIFGLVALQLGIAYAVKDLPWYFVLAIAWCVGAFANHGLFVLIHECTHNMSAAFRKYHLKHHAFQGHYEIDADIASRWEAKLIGNTFIGKSFWLLLFPIFQALRPPRLKEISFSNKWIWINLFTVAVVDVAIFLFVGPMAIVYLVGSFFFSVGLHPLGGRWIQEHFLVSAPQETYSYYGPLNKLAFNVGYHNEHHDFSFVPWNNLPKIKAIAPEYYDSLESHDSWSKLVWKFLSDKNLSLFSRTLRDDKGGLKVTKGDESDFFNGREMKEKAPLATAAS